MPRMNSEYWREKPGMQRKIVRGVFTSRERIWMEKAEDPRVQDLMDVKLSLHESLANSRIGVFIADMRRAFSGKPNT